MFGRFRAGAADHVPAALEELWVQVEARWTDSEMHERFLAQVSLCGAYAYAASRYRRAARTRQSSAISRLQLERLSRMVHAVMAVSAVRPAGERGTRPYRIIAVLILVVGLGGIGSVYMFSRSGAGAQESIVPPSIQVRRGRSIGPDGRPAAAFGGLRAAGAARGDAGLARELEGDGDEGHEPAEPGDVLEEETGADQE
jgi:hypothetical protein